MSVEEYNVEELLEDSEYMYDIPHVVLVHTVSVRVLEMVFSVHVVLRLFLSTTYNCTMT
jgi:hypothetical protein